MKMDESPGLDPQNLSLVLESLPVAVTVVDLDGRMVYFNHCASQVLDRKQEYLGKDIRLCHRKPESNTKIDRMIEAFKMGSQTPFYYEADRYGRRIAVTVTPWTEGESLKGCIQTVIVKS
jgi:PAS domain S-box-containing protein